MNSDTGQANKAISVFSKIQRIFIKGTDKEERQRELRIDLDLLSGIGPLGRQVCAAFALFVLFSLNNLF